MSESDLDDMCRPLKKLLLDDLHELANQSMSFVPPLARLTRDQVIGKMRCALTNVYDRSVRLKYVASIYCHLIDKAVLSPWSLYHLGAPRGHTSDFLRFHRRLLSTMQHPGSDNAQHNTSNYGAFRSAFCLTGPEPHLEDHDVVCLCAWVGWPYVAIYAPKEACTVRVIDALENVLPDDQQKLFQGVHFDINSVYSTLDRNSRCDRSASANSMNQGLKKPQRWISIRRK